MLARFFASRIWLYFVFGMRPRSDSGDIG